MWWLALPALGIIIWFIISVIIGLIMGPIIKRIEV